MDKFYNNFDDVDRVHAVLSSTMMRNLFTVTFPVDWGLAAEDVETFHYSFREKKLFINFREIEGHKTLENLSRIKDTYRLTNDEIIVNVLNREGESISERHYEVSGFPSLEEDSLSYVVKDDDRVLRVLCMFDAEIVSVDER